MLHLTWRVSLYAATFMFAVIAACASDSGHTHSQDSTASAPVSPPARGPVAVGLQAPDSRAASVPVILINDAADTQHVRGTGVPTATDDTLGTQYGKHWGPARILRAPPCRPQGIAICLSDTARTVR